MKQNNSITKRISSGRKSRFLATWQMLHRVVAILVLAFVCGEVWAGDYVFMYNDGKTTHYLSNNGKSLDDATTFNPTTCIWSGTSGSYFSNQGKYLAHSGTETTFSLSNSTGNTTKMTINGTAIYRNGYSNIALRYLYYLNSATLM